MSTPEKSTQIQKTEARDFSAPSLLDLRVVDRCCAQAQAACDEALAEGKSEDAARENGKRIHRASMPAPLDPGSTADFIACVTIGVLAGLIPLKEANALYYAGQVALSLQRKSSPQEESLPPHPTWRNFIAKLSFFASSNAGLNGGHPLWETGHFTAFAFPTCIAFAVYRWQSPVVCVKRK